MVMIRRKDFLRMGGLGLACAVLLGRSAGFAGAASGSYIDFDAHQSAAQLSLGSESGVVVRDDGVRLAPGRASGTLTSLIYDTSTGVDTFVPSFNAYTPAGTYIKLEMKVYSGGWTGWFNMGMWARGAGNVRRQSVKGQRAGSWQVLTDTLQSIGRVFASAYQYRLTLSTEKAGASPAVRAVYVTSSNSFRHGEDLGVAPLRSAWGRELAMPARSQMVYPDGGEIWCSPTSLSMVMGQWAAVTGNGAMDQPVPTVARGVYDPNAGPAFYGNWPFNTAYAGAYGLKAAVHRFSSIAQVERWIDVGVPVVATIAWDNRNGAGSNTYLGGAALPSSGGHLLVIKGFAGSGDVIVNDPAASNSAGVRRVYSRAQFSRAWLRNGSGGVAYLVHPQGWATPDSSAAHGSW